MNASNHHLFFETPLPGINTNFVSDAREAAEANVTVALEGSRAVWNGIRAVSEETGTFLAERVRSQTAFFEGLLNCHMPQALFTHVTDFWKDELKAWDDEQGRILGLFAQALTETMLEADALELAGPSLG